MKALKCHTLFHSLIHTVEVCQKIILKAKPVMASIRFSSKILRNPNTQSNLTSTFFKAQLENKHQKCNLGGHSCANSDCKFLQQSQKLNALKEAGGGRTGFSCRPVSLSRFTVKA